MLKIDKFRAVVDGTAILKRISRYATLALVALSSAPAAAEQLCLAGEYRLPESIGEEMRPYLLCGLFQGRDSHFTVRLNGYPVSMRGSAESCGEVRQRALTASVARLAATMADANARQSFVLVEFEKADRFLDVAGRSEDLTVGDERTAPACRISDAQDR
jgi:hypothetical protein